MGVQEGEGGAQPSEMRELQYIVEKLVVDMSLIQQQIKEINQTNWQK